jgi:hypothetical protein
MITPNSHLNFIYEKEDLAEIEIWGSDNQSRDLLYIKDDVNDTLS